MGKHAMYRRHRRQGPGAARNFIGRTAAVRRAVEALEGRQLLSGTAPVAAADAYTTAENQPLVTTAGTTSLYLTGSSFIYNGTHTWTPADGTFAAFEPYDRTDENAVEVTFTGTNYPTSGDGWTLEFAAPAGQVLTAGTTYTGAERFPFETGTAPGLDVYGDGRGSNTVAGQFTVLQATFNPDGSVASFAATFQHLSEGLASRETDGTVYYHYVPAGSQAGVLVNDTDAEGNPLTARVVAQPAHGTVVMAADGSFTYAPAAGFAGTDSFTYVANDGTSDSAVATATVTVTPVNQPPTFVVGPNQAVTQDAGPQAVPGWATAISPGPANEAGQQVSFAVMADSDPALFSTAPVVAADGTLTYTPAAGVYGTATLSVVAQDNGGTANGGQNTSAAQTFTITVNRVDHAPVATDDTFTTPAGTALVTTPAAGVLANDTDPDGDALTAAVVTGPAHGTLSLAADGSFTYTPAAGFNGYDSFTYQASDGTLSSNVATVRLTVGTPPAPIPNAGGPYTVPEGGSITLSAVSSTDPTGTIASYEWDLNYNGTTFTADATGVTTTFSAADLDGPTTQVVGLRVTDVDGRSSLTKAVVTVADVPPTGTFAAGPAVQLGSAATVGFTNVTDPSAADTAAGFTYSYDFNDDGTFDVVNSTGATATVPASALTTVGPHTVVGRVRDKDGGYTDYTAVVTVTPTPTPTPTATVALSSLTPTSATTGWGTVTRNLSVGGNTLSLGGVKYASGMGVHAVSTLAYNLAGQYTTFTSDVGVDDEENGKGTGSVDFQVIGDGKVLFDSGVLHNGATVKGTHLSVSVAGVKTLTLVATNGVPNDIDYDHSDWAGATLTGTPAAPTVPGVPTGLTATAAAVTGAVTLAWTPADATATSYAVDRSTDGTTWTTVTTTVAGTATTWTDPATLAAGTTYDYRIRAANAAGASANSAVATVTTPAKQTVTYLSDLTWTSATAGWGTVQKDQSVGGNPLTLAGATYAKGIGTHAASTVTYNLAGAYSTFAATVGIDAEEDGKGIGHVDFQVVGDGKVLFDSGVLVNDQAKQVSVSVAGVKTLQLVATNGITNDIDYDHADWAAAVLGAPVLTQWTGTAIGSAAASGHAASAATDGNLTTYFESTKSNGGWVGLDLGQSRSISQIRFAPRSGQASRMVGGVFQVSTTADFSSGVTTIYTITAAPAQGSLTTVTLASPVTGRYVRYVGPNGSYCDVADIQSFG